MRGVFTLYKAKGITDMTLPHALILYQLLINTFRKIKAWPPWGQ